VEKINCQTILQILKFEKSYLVMDVLGMKMKTLSTNKFFKRISTLKHVYLHTHCLSLFLCPFPPVIC